VIRVAGRVKMKPTESKAAAAGFFVCFLIWVKTMEDKRPLNSIIGLIALKMIVRTNSESVDVDQSSVFSI
jgi:hypothetical protein